MPAVTAALEQREQRRRRDRHADDVAIHRIDRYGDTHAVKPQGSPVSIQDDVVDE
jgi:hypothetical protein